MKLFFLNFGDVNFIVCFFGAFRLNTVLGLICFLLTSLNGSVITTLCCQSLVFQITQFANSIDPDEVAHNEPPHLDLHYLLFSLL